MSQVYGAGGKTLPKAGRLATGSYSMESPIKGGDQFPPPSDYKPKTQQRGTGLPGRSNLVMPQDRINGTAQEGHVIGTQRNTATQPFRPNVQTKAGSQNTQLDNNITYKGIHGGRNIILMPHEKPTFFLRKPQPIVKTQFGASKNDPADTAFHPIIKPVYHPPMNQTPTLGERTAAQSFSSRNNNWYDPNNSFVKGQAQAGGTGNGIGVGRWQTVKRGAAG